MRKSRSTTLVLYALAALAACAGGDTAAKRVADTGTATRNSSSPSSAVAGLDSTDASTVDARPLLWDSHAVVTRLSAAGLLPEPQGEIRQPFLGAPGTTVRLAGGAAEIQVFIYGDAGAVGRDTKGLHPTRVAPATMQITWIMPASLVVDNNLAAIVLTRDEALRMRIRAALTARSNEGR